MIVSPVEIQIFFISQIRDLIRIPAGLICISRIREKRIQNHPIQHTVRRRKCALHFIVYHAVIRQFPVLVLQLVAPSLLAEDFFMLINIRMKHGIHIDIHQILKILIITACDRIHRLIRIRHGIQKGVQRSFDQFHKRILSREFLRSAEYRMLHDMRHTGTVLRRCAECNVKDFVIIIIGNQQHSCPALFMLQKCTFWFQIIQFALLNHLICSQFCQIHVSVPPNSIL